MNERELAMQAARSRKYRSAHKLEYSLSFWRYKTGLSFTADEYRAMWTAQGEQCALIGVGACFNPADRRMALDHDYETGRVRGIICWRHNQALAAIGDGDPEALHKLVVYLARD
jgi:hypothetical protein